MNLTSPAGPPAGPLFRNVLLSLPLKEKLINTGLILYFLVVLEASSVLCLEMSIHPDFSLL